MKKTRRVLTFVLAFVLMLSSVNVFAAKNEKRNPALNGIIVNGHIVYSDVEPYIKNSRTYVPIRFIAEELGYDVKWNAKEKMVTMKADETNVELKIGSDNMKVKDKDVKLDAPPEIKDSRTFVPLRAIAEAFGEKVDYSKDYRAVYIGDSPKYDAFYKVVYYYEKQDPIVSKYTINIANNNLEVDGIKTEYKSINELINVVYKDFYLYGTTKTSDFGVDYYKTNSSEAPKEETKFITRVPADKQLKDDQYIKPTSDPLVGTWYGTTTWDDTDLVINEYLYIVNVGKNKYKITNRDILESDLSSVFYTVQYATYDESINTLVFEDSEEAYSATGFFKGKEPYSPGGEYVLYEYWNKLSWDGDLDGDGYDKY